MDVFYGSGLASRKPNNPLVADDPPSIVVAVDGWPKETCGWDSSVAGVVDDDPNLNEKPLVEGCKEEPFKRPSHVEVEPNSPNLSPVFNLDWSTAELVEIVSSSPFLDY